MLSSMYDLILIESQSNRDTTDDSSIQFIDNVNHHILNGNSCKSNSCKSNSSSGSRKSKRKSSSNSSSNISSRNQYMNDNDDRVNDHILIGSSIKRSKVSSNSTIHPIEKNDSDSSRNVVGSNITQQSTKLVCTVIEPIISNTIGSKKCVHSRERSTCKDCGGSGICEHSRKRSQCKDCGGSSICEHNSQRSTCKDCG